MTDISTEHLKYTIGDQIKNHDGITLGKVEDIKFDTVQNIPAYLILYCDALFGITDRYFAIPATPSLLQINQQGKITIRVDRKVLQIVVEINTLECPQWETKISASIFELYEYGDSKLSI
jgi:hypothetical protein